MKYIKTDLMTDEELKEFNDFLQENPIRNKFLPVLAHVSKLKPRGYHVEEFADKEGNTSSVLIFIEAIDEDGIQGRVGVDAFDKDKISFEIWWGGECYCLLHTAVQMQNFLSYILGRLNLDNVSPVQRSRFVRKQTSVLPFV